MSKKILEQFNHSVNRGEKKSDRGGGGGGGGTYRSIFSNIAGSRASRFEAWINCSSMIIFDCRANR